MKYSQDAVFTMRYKHLRNIIKVSRISRSTITKVINERDEPKKDLNDIDRQALVDLCTSAELLRILNLYKRKLRKVVEQNAYNVRMKAKEK